MMNGDVLSPIPKHGRDARGTRRFFRRHRIGALLLGAPLFAWLAFCAAVEWWPYPGGIDRPPAAGTFIEDRQGVPLAALVAADDQWHLPLLHDQISPHLLRAIVAVEDGRFQEHHGIDWKSVAGALWQDVRHLGIRRGGSTLTMQLQRLRDPKPRTLFNKIEQAIRARQLEKRSTKESILVEYLNRAPFGGNLVGAGAASWRYFGRPCRDLSLGEAALLAGLPQSPKRLRPDRHPAAAKARRDHVLDRMLACGMIDQKQRDEAAAEPIAARWLPLPQDSIPSAMPTLAGLAHRYPGQVVHSTLDRSIERQAAELTEKRLQSLRVSGISAAAVVVLDTPTGECLSAISLSQPASTTQPAHSTLAAKIDLTRRPRSTGSTLKPFIYAAAFDMGVCTPKSTLFDSPAAWPGYVPGNFDRTFRGPMPAAEALAESRNIPALVLLGHVGVERAVGVIESFGIATPAQAKHPFGLSLAIGGAEATPLELAEAYATLARGGVWRKTSLVREGATSERRVMRADPCLQTIKAISAEERTATVSPDAAALHVAWKTGTSSGHRDAWCAAITPRRTVVVWLGNPNGAGSAGLIGQESAAPLALQLIATLDSGGANWPEIPEPPSRIIEKRTTLAARSASSLTIVSPSRDQQVWINPDLALDRQQVLLEATAADGEIWWFVDEQPIGHEARTWWSPTAGTHRIRIVDGDGQSASVSLRVDAIGRTTSGE